MITIIIRRRRRRNRFVRERRFGGFVVKTMWHNDGCEKGENNRRMTAAYGRGLPRAAASLTQFLGPAGAGSLQAILYTTTSHYQIYYYYYYYYTHRYENQSDHTRFSRYRSYWRRKLGNIYIGICTTSISIQTTHLQV